MDMNPPCPTILNVPVRKPFSVCCVQNVQVAFPSCIQFDFGVGAILNVTLYRINATYKA